MWIHLLITVPWAAQAGEDPHERMATHLALAEQARAAVIEGELDGAVSAGRQLMELPVDGLPEAWSPYLDDLRQGARELAGAQQLEVAARSVSQLVQACASCHQGLEGGPRLTGPSAPAPTWSDATPMPRHRWAADWMFLGLLASDDGAFQRGTRALAEGPFLAEDETHPDAAEAARKAVVDLATRLSTSQDPGERVTLYGDLLGQCGACHAALAAGPGASPP